MKIYTRIVMDLTQDDLPVLEAEGFEYDGPLALCWGVGAGAGVSGGVGAGAGVGGGVGAGDDGDEGDDGGDGNGDGRGGGMNASGFGLGSPMGGTFGDPGGRGYSSAASQAEGRGIGPDGGYSGPNRGHSVNAPRGMLSDPEFSPLSHMSRSQQRAHANLAHEQNMSRNPRSYGFMDQLGHAARVAWDSGALGALGSVAMGNPIGMARGTLGAIGYSRDYSDARAAAGLGPVTGPGSGFGTPSGNNSGDMLAQTPQTTSPTEPRILPERPPDGEMTTDDLARVSEGSPMKNALRLAFSKNIDATKKQYLAQALRQLRGAQ